MSHTIYSQEIQAVIDELSKITDLTPDQKASLSAISKHCLEISIFERKRGGPKQILASTNSNVSFAELVQDHLSQGYEELAKLINKIDQTKLKTSVAMEEAAAQAKLEEIKRNVDKIIQHKKNMINELNVIAEKQVESGIALGQYDNEEKFKTSLKTYAKSMRPLTNKLVITCPIYSPKTPLSSSKDKTVEDVTKEMTEAFFKELRDQGYNVEECAIIIGGRKHTFTDAVSSSDQSKYISEAKTNASKLLTGSYISKESYFDENMTKEDQARLKEILQQQRKAEAEAKAAVNVSGPSPTDGAIITGIDNGPEVKVVGGDSGNGATFQGGGPQSRN